MGRNWAITIGINGYRNLQRLNYAKRDAEAIQSFLQQELNVQTVYHFTDDSPAIPQDYGPDLDSYPTYATLRRFFRIRFEEPFLRPGDNLWFFFAGHGKRYEDRDYLMPIDADPGDEAERSTWLPLSYITDRLRRSGADNVVMLIDACRSGEGRRDSSGFGQEKQQGVITLFACSPWESSYEIDELQQGAFTHALLQGLQIEGEGNCATVERLYQRLRQTVPQVTQQYKRVQQTPYGVVEPPTKYHLILLPRKANLADIDTLKLDAQRAELRRDFKLAKQLWIRVLAASPADHDAVEGIERLARVSVTPDIISTLTPSLSPSGDRSVTQSGLKSPCSYWGRVRPLHPGLAVGNERGGWGTLSCFVRKKGQPDILLLSSSHILARYSNTQLGDRILQPGREEEDQPDCNTIARLQEVVHPNATQINTVEAALATVLSTVEIDATYLPEVGRLQGLVQAPIETLLNQEVIIIGARTGSTRGRISQIADTVSLPWQTENPLQFSGLITIEAIDDTHPFCQPGDSGALVVTLDGWAIAVLLSRSVSKTTTQPRALGLPLGPILEALNLELVVSTQNPPTVEFEVVTLEVKRPECIAEGEQTAELIAHRRSELAKYWVEDLQNGVSLELMVIPGGSFQMGSPDTEEGRSNDEGPQHQVTIKPFLLGKYPVTQAQWRAVAALPKISQDLKLTPSTFKGENRPVEGVSWNDAVEFCDRLSYQTGRKYRLPSEAEWEYACRAGTKSSFHFGETVTTELANYRGIDWEYEGKIYSGSYGVELEGEYREQTTEVGIFPPNTFGLYDMHGNVWEWCLDHWHENYQGAPTDGSAWIKREKNSSVRVLRGGAWVNYPQFCRSAYRARDFPDVRSRHFGFRIVCDSVWTL